MPSAGTRKDLGTKHECHECGAKYYDLHRPVPTCPKCGADPRETPEATSRPGAAAHRRPPLEVSHPPKRVATNEMEEDEDEEDDDDDRAVEVMADPSFKPPKFGGDSDDKDDSDDDSDDDDVKDDSDDTFESEEIS